MKDIFISSFILKKYIYIKNNLSSFYAYTKIFEKIFLLAFIYRKKFHKKYFC